MLIGYEWIINANVEAIIIHTELVLYTHWILLFWEICGACHTGAFCIIVCTRDNECEAQTWGHICCHLETFTI